MDCGHSVRFIYTHSVNVGGVSKLEYVYLPIENKETDT
jgi:hypothetical protein